MSLLVSKLIDAAAVQARYELKNTEKYQHMLSTFNFAFLSMSIEFEYFPKIRVTSLSIDY
jgi:hypothetical protein